ncbi:preprotein translocase subunit SecA, partial [Schleiferilactobacillus perolens]|uniref:preprotein translocase subunit SecA n=1 Tax=Schleiferilactobacillus perolens TaxID=100468 RepID=UPI001F26B90B
MNKRVLKRYMRITDQIVSLLPKFKELSDGQLQAKTIALKTQLAAGHTLKEVLIEAYATAAEADRRVLGLTPYNEQILGAVALEYNNVAEMKTGEGKTLTATMPMYLHGLTGPGNFLITANDYLADRDAAQMGQVYSWLGVSTASGVAKPGHEDDERDKQDIYSHDIVYTTNSTLGFDYLLDNLAANQSDLYIRPFRFALLDEVDAILLDMAQMPLIISGAPRAQSNLFEPAEALMSIMTPKVDFEQSDDNKKAWFTPTGIRRMNTYFDVDDILSEEHANLYRHMVLALEAHFLYVKDRDYVADNDKVALLDLANGRELSGMHLEAGLHQAIEAKEHVKLSAPTRAMASITYQNLFRMFPQLAGMTGTAKTDAAELRETYNMDVVVIPTHQPTIRVDRPDHLFVTNEEKIIASLKEVQKAYKQHRPVLIETGSVSMSNLYSRLLLSAGIPHNLLNARSAAKEAKIVATAGRVGAVTVATSMAGRGTDIILDKETVAMGGLLVIGTERMTSERVDNQLRGRAGRQGYPGQSVFYVSLEDRVVIENSPKWVKKYRKKHAPEAVVATDPQPLRQHRFHKLVLRAQQNVTKTQRGARFQTLEFDEVFRVQREYIYRMRSEVMNAGQLNEQVIQVLKTATFNFSHQKKHQEMMEIADFILNSIDYSFTPNELVNHREYSDVKCPIIVR